MGKDISISYQDKPVSAYLATPEGDSKGGVIVIHEVWGLNDHTKDVADRFAQAGYVALAPNFLEGTPIEAIDTAEIQKALFDPARRNDIQPKLRELTAPMQAPDFAEITDAKLKACFDYLYDLAETKKQVSVVGFCFGGTYSFNLAIHEPRLKAAVPFYGHSNHTESEYKQIKCPILAFYGEKDENLMSALDQLKSDMQKAGVNFTAQVYPNCGHAFFNDTNPFAYNEAAAKDSWTKTLEFLAK